jgi:hypothetical protein
MLDRRKGSLSRRGPSHPGLRAAGDEHRNFRALDGKALLSPLALIELSVAEPSRRVARVLNAATFAGAGIFGRACDREFLI